MSESKGRLIPVDVYDREGNMLRVEFSDSTGNHVLDAQWDENDEQSSENRVAFRKWAYNHLRNQGWEILK
jgi:hypothetical protein